MDQQIIGRFLDHKSVEQCVHDLIELGVSKDKISLITHHADSHRVAADAIGVFQKNGDISSQSGDTLVGGIIGSIIGSVVGVATFTLPGIGLMLGAGPLVTGLCGGTIGGIVGANAEELYTDTNSLHPYVSALKEGEILCGVDVESDSVDEIKKVISKYAVSINK